MRNTRARATGAAWRSAGLAATLALCACAGPDLISLGGTPPNPSERFLSPAGNDRNLGTYESPWKTFAHALPQLMPGWTLQLLNGTYEHATTGTLNVRCPGAAQSATAPDAGPAPNGLPGMPITIRAFKEHGAFVRGSGSVPPVSVSGCHDWIVQGLHVESQSVPDTLTTPETGSVVVIDGSSSNVTFERLLALRPNRYKRSNVIRVGDGSSAVTVEECELYDFHHNAIEASRSTALVLQRNYINSRDTPDSTDAGAYQSEDPVRGDNGVWLEETSNVYAMNNVVERVAVGFGLVGRDADPHPEVAGVPIDHNWLLGNIVNEPAVMGVLLDSRCQGQPTCDMFHTILHTTLDNDVVIGGSLGVYDAGSVETSINELTIINAARGIALIKDLVKNKALQASATVTNTLIAGFQSVALAESDEAMWGCDHCAAVGGYNPTAAYAPDEAQKITKVDVMPSLGTCLVYLPADSPLQKAGKFGLPVGANVLQKYDDSGSLIPGSSLWDSAFPCGAIVDANRALDTSCSGMAMRLHVGVQYGCPLP